ncbi:carboxypeptidase-like regulatory domain-containing protein [Hufsiella ginkgonis]|uniref:Carboxypeptidase regulatory-like domain-containing protein n=1 Tax=Hufsiella ginkgonis TaxID=2695274 RepID=A0A7K1Y048_9SPHI|nr:carboxypeptidase-like regulatory domain-containing protein [Hufsiella ginkgonis]MXV16590.1 carboxypeptidase regulatory-like domain-containing protein [Hufsiella ginkgonis]
MKIRQTLAILTILLCCVLPAFSQRDSVSLSTVINKTNTLMESRPLEKVYLHFDKPYYAINDTIWFKAYLTFGLHQPSELSKIVYVDIISSRDSLVRTLMLPVKDGAATGSVPLTPPMFKQDNYHIKAYTKWMANFDQAYFFNKTISVGNSINKQVTSRVAFKRSVSNNIPQVSASITYNDPDGNPYTNKKVNWVITSGFDEIAKGRETTDDKGLLTINFANTRSLDLAGAVLTTTLDAGNKKEYDQVYPLKSVAAPNDVQFFPEGGSLIGSIRSKVAVKAIQSNGLGTDFSATVTDNSGASITTFDSQHAGLGAFVFTPDAGKSYKVNVDFKDGTRGSYDLPRVRASGILLSASVTDTSKIFIRLTADSTYFKSRMGQTFYVLGKSGQVICYAAQISLNSPSFSAYIPTGKFPSGVVQITLMSNTGIPLSERVVFVSHKDQLGLTVASDKPVYGRRQKVKLSITAKNSVTPAFADLSLSVIDETRIPVNESTETTILSHLLLSSDLKGYIENPNYYFRQVTEKTMADLDLLMLTQGYRRFTYQEILSGKIPPVVYLPEQGIELTGTLRALDGRPFKGGVLNLSIPDKYYSARAVSDAEGKFKFPNLAFADSAQVIVSAKGNYNAKSLMVMMDGTAYPAVEKNPNYPDERLNIDTMMVNYLQNVKKIYESSRVLKEITITSKAPKKTTTVHTDYPALTGLSPNADHVINGDRLTGCNNVLTCLQTMAFGVTLVDNVFYVARDYNAGQRIPMAVFVKGMPVDVSYLMSLNPAEIESVEIFLKDDLGLVNRAYQTNGVLVINTKTAPKGTKISLQELQDIIGQPSVAKMSPKGYDFAKVFYVPKYVVGTNTFGPDLRTTIFWNPKVLTDAAGKASAEFFSADNKGTYRAVVEGIDKEGRIGRTVYRFKVE